MTISFSFGAVFWCHDHETDWHEKQPITNIQFFLTPGNFIKQADQIRAFSLTVYKQTANNTWVCHLRVTQGLVVYFLRSTTPTKSLPVHSLVCCKKQKTKQKNKKQIMHLFHPTCCFEKLFSFCSYLLWMFEGTFRHSMINEMINIWKYVADCSEE